MPNKIYWFQRAMSGKALVNPRGSGQEARQLGEAAVLVGGGGGGLFLFWQLS